MQTDRHTDALTGRSTDIETDGQTSIHADRHTDAQTSRSTDRQMQHLQVIDGRFSQGVVGRILSDIDKRVFIRFACFRSRVICRA